MPMAMNFSRELPVSVRDCGEEALTADRSILPKRQTRMKHDVLPGGRTRGRMPDDEEKVNRGGSSEVPTPDGRKCSTMVLPRKAAAGKAFKVWCRLCEPRRLIQPTLAKDVQMRLLGIGRLPKGLLLRLPPSLCPWVVLLWHSP
jgi:hypothetical protein